MGNRLTQEALAGSNAYDYDMANRLIEVDGVPYTWDDNGNLLDDGVREYAYDHANRLMEVDLGSDEYEFSYNGLGDRLVQVVNGVPIHYTLDLAAGLPQVLTDADNAYLYGVSRIGEQQPDGWQYHLSDALGSVRELADPSSEAVYLRTYQPFGSVLRGMGSAISAYGFTAEQHDSTGLLYLRARYYGLADGRFTSHDPWRGNILSPVTLNGWSYVEANPTNHVDPSGLISGAEAGLADEILARLENVYQVKLVKDWGFRNSFMGILGSCRWQEGDWTILELGILERGVSELGKRMGSADAFVRNIGGRHGKRGQNLGTRSHLRSPNQVHGQSYVDRRVDRGARIGACVG